MLNSNTLHASGGVAAMNFGEEIFDNDRENENLTLNS